MIHLMNFEKLHLDGWQVLDDISDHVALRAVAHSLGDLVPDSLGQVETLLRPSHSDEVRSRSFSFRHGHDTFPLHTDTAFLANPIRYIVLWSPMPSTTTTVILPKKSTERLFLSLQSTRALFCLRTVSGVRYSNIRLEEPMAGFRFDPNIMKAANNEANQLASKLEQLAEDELVHIAWTGRSGLVIDNWQCLHGRSKVAANDLSRRLLRLYVNPRKTDDVGK